MLSISFKLLVFQTLFSPFSLDLEPLNISWSSGIDSISQPPLELDAATWLSFGQWDVGGSVGYLSLLLLVGWNVDVMAEPWAAIMDHEVGASA